MPERLSAVGATTPRTESAASPLPAEAPGKPSPCLESHARLAASSAAFMRTKVRVGAAAAWLWLQPGMGRDEAGGRHREGEHLAGEGGDQVAQLAMSSAGLV
eukprot:CAMPEP_0202744982 /NCGR_PEP_ID=MMETSP1388-20130828/7015_1 /ASSEMBLY_ACC=CAM_ASM_000864 /TAXON_ID=37098 /ORGANISM="Isochrysis sp, Strain CCMP1244" /LENGTH=101 /DNA_ID=CAMNT_0049412121 /DNA_START=477 /DNA_END=777 /DNA_ORIENTATION=+